MSASADTATVAAPAIPPAKQASILTHARHVIGENPVTGFSAAT